MNGPNNTNPETPVTETSAPFVVKLFAVLGFIAIVVLAAWMSVQVIRFTPSALSTAAVSLTSLFTGFDQTTLTIDLSSRVVDSGSAFTMPIGGTKPSGGYAFSYTCAEGVTIAVRTATGSTPVACDTPFIFATSPLVFLATSTKDRYTDVTVTVAGKTADGTDAGAAKVLLTIVNPAAGTVESPKPKPATTPAPAPIPVVRQIPAQVSDPNGTPDLAVTVSATGIVSKKGGKEVFTAMSPIPEDERAAVRFVVKNVGTKTTEKGWDFTAYLPIAGDERYEYESAEQPALRPGDTIEFTLSFDEILEEKTGTITIELFPADRTDRESNNTAKTTVRIDR